MFEQTRIIKLNLFLIVIILFVLSFEGGVYFAKKQYREKLNNTFDVYQTEIIKLESSLGIKDHRISNVTSQLQEALNDNDSLSATNKELHSQILGLQVNDNYPFTTPSSGIIGTYNGTFGGNMNGMRHLGVDIWTTTENNGRIANHKGNPVYSACDGKVTNIDPDNAAITILCDPISENFDVPKREVYTHYAHLGNADTGNLFVEVGRNQRVTKGQLIGYQGDKSSYFPEMRNVHLHFSVFTGLSETDLHNGGALNPCLYIGGDCSRAGSEFTI
ncbi:peptidoglycan DD-metalloendopeptidase family protein [Candidatus Dojkabacteria bacterium]|nr:peptidoglycan DD-metalloendopeptidase family protein [Candidatus Dojkabacteria bacterium]